MGPLIPLAALFGGLWYLDDKSKEAPKVGQKDVRPVPHFSKSAVNAVTEMREGTRYFRLCDLDLSNFALEHVPLEGATAIAMFKLVPLDIGTLGAEKAVTDALSKGLCVLGSLSCALSEPGTDTMLLLFVPPAKKALASPASQFAVLAEPAPVEESVVEKPVVKRRNGLVKTAETEVEKAFPSPVEKAEA